MRFRKPRAINPVLSITISLLRERERRWMGRTVVSETVEAKTPCLLRQTRQGIFTVTAGERPSQRS